MKKLAIALVVASAVTLVSLVVSGVETPAPSPRPRGSDWNQATPVTPTRSDDPRCRARRLREWVQIRCTFDGVNSVAMIAGTKDGVNAWVVERESREDTAVIELRVRPGDRRVFQVNGQSRYGAFPLMTVQQSWLDDEPEPVLLVQRAF